MYIDEAKELVIKAGIKLAKSGLIARTWGNVSCRVDEKSFVITPSGRNYYSLTTDEIVKINIEDLSYDGNIKPSSEKGIHAEIYKAYPNINFLIHTHQQNASVIAASQIDSIKSECEDPLLDGEITCAKYALPGTKSLRKNVVNAIKSSKTNATIMKYHGALCMGKNLDEAFKVASELEDICHEYIVNQYFKLSKREKYDPLEMSLFALTKNNQGNYDVLRRTSKINFNGKRDKEGFILFDSEKEILIRQNNLLDSSIPEEAKIYDSIFKDNKDINYIIFDNSPELLAIAHKGSEFKPILDDYAQIAGLHTRNVENNPELISKALRKSPVVFVRDLGAFCCGKTYDDAEAVQLVTQKAGKAFIGASLFGEVKPIKTLECRLMRFVYLKKYSKKALEK